MLANECRIMVTKYCHGLVQYFWTVRHNLSRRLSHLGVDKVESFRQSHIVISKAALAINPAVVERRI